MFQILSDPQFDFMRHRKTYLIVSGVLVLLSVVALLGFGINEGIEFTGGTEVQIKFRDAPDLTEIRQRVGEAMAEEGVDGAPIVTTIGDPEMHEVTIRVATAAEEEGEENAMTRLVVRSLRSEEDLAKEAAGQLNLNEIERSVLARELGDASGIEPEEAMTIATAITDYRRERALIESFDTLEQIEAVSPLARAFIEERFFLGSFALRSQSYIGPAVGGELMQKALGAIFGSLAGVLIYIGLRFQFRWGVAALVALFHDAIITLGLFAAFQKEMSLPVVAAFLTLVGYSVNDTVVVFDRIRENLKRRGGQKLEQVINRAINQTLSRTMITSGLTWVVVLGLYLFGGEALKPFSFVLTIGVLIGTYSSICVASPVLLLWQESKLKRKGVSPASGDRVARKVTT